MLDQLQLQATNCLYSRYFGVKLSISTFFSLVKLQMFVKLEILTDLVVFAANSTL